MNHSSVLALMITNACMHKRLKTFQILVNKVREFQQIYRNINNVDIIVNDMLLLQMLDIVIDRYCYIICYRYIQQCLSEHTFSNPMESIQKQNICITPLYKERTVPEISPLLHLPHFGLETKIICSNSCIMIYSSSL